MEQSDDKIKRLRQLARGDREYRELELRFLGLEKRFFHMVNTLPEKQQDLAWEFVCASDALDARLLEIAWDALYLNKEKSQ